MKVKFGSIIVDGSGKIGGHVVGHCRDGHYMRTKGSKVGSVSGSQQVVRSRTGSIASSWRELTSNQRTAWDNATIQFQRSNVFGDKKQLSGFALYQSLNNNILTIGGSMIQEPPKVERVYIDRLVNFYISVIGALQMLVQADSGYSVNDYYEFWCTQGCSAGQSFAKNKYRLVHVAPASNGPVFNISSSYLDVFTKPFVGQKVFCKVRAVNILTGQASPFQSISALAVLF